MSRAFARFAAVALVSLLLPVAALSAEAGEHPGDAVAGQRISKAEQCQECHGEDGNSLSMSTPKLAGQSTAYLAKQLADFRSGARRHVVMSEMAAPLGEADRLDIAAYFSGRKKSAEPDKLFSLKGRDLFLYGDMERDIPQCANCHGDKGQGSASRGVSYPALAGQHRTYLRIQLLKWRMGERGNSPDGVMNRIAQQLSDDEIGALADYLSGL
ncbi:MAG TPA: c-type cytochrome [Gallionella sp.]|nr:c-type cytochrome [Gallionella sp.]